MLGTWCIHTLWKELNVCVRFSKQLGKIKIKTGGNHQNSISLKIAEHAVSVHFVCNYFFRLLLLLLLLLLLVVVVVVVVLLLLLLLLTLLLLMMIIIIITSQSVIRVECKTKEFFNKAHPRRRRRHSQIRKEDQGPSIFTFPAHTTDVRQDSIPGAAKW